MKNILIVLVWGFLFFSFNNNKVEVDNFVKLDSLLSEKLKIAFINSANYTQSPWLPTYKQLETIDSIIAVAIKEQNYHYEHLTPDSIKNYYRQYVFSVDSKGDSIVYINAICEVHERQIVTKDGKKKIKRDDWQHEIGIVEDGGDCYWRIKINFSTKKYQDFFVNGEA